MQFIYSRKLQRKTSAATVIIDTLSETKSQTPTSIEKLLWAFNYRNFNDSCNSGLRISVINAFVKLDMRSMIDPLVTALSDTDEATRKAAMQALITLQVPQAQIESMINADNPLTKEAARDILKTIAPGRLEELTQPKVIAPVPELFLRLLLLYPIN